MRLVFIGTGEIGVPTLHALLKSARHQLAGVVTQPDKPVGPRSRIACSTDQNGDRSKRSPDFSTGAHSREWKRSDEIRALNPEVIVVMAYGQILPKISFRNSAGRFV